MSVNELLNIRRPSAAWDLLFSMIHGLTPMATFRSVRRAFFQQAPIL